jgi:hypothetical protein
MTIRSSNSLHLLIVLLVLSGCTSTYLAKQQDLAWQRETGQISEKQYQDALRKQRKSLPLEERGGWPEEPPPYYQETFDVK